MGRRTRRYEAQFVTCLLVHGPIPDNDKGINPEYHAYSTTVMAWWHDSHEGTPPRSRSLWKFWKRYRTWYEVHGRRITNDATT